MLVLNTHTVAVNLFLQVKLKKTCHERNMKAAKADLNFLKLLLPGFYANPLCSLTQKRYADINVSFSPGSNKNSEGVSYFFMYFEELSLLENYKKNRTP